MHEIQRNGVDQSLHLTLSVELDHLRDSMIENKIEFIAKSGIYFADRISYIIQKKFSFSPLLHFCVEPIQINRSISFSLLLSVSSIFI